MSTLGKFFAALTSLAITLTPAAAGESAGPSVAAKRTAIAEVLGEARGAKHAQARNLGHRAAVVAKNPGAEVGSRALQCS